MFRHPDLIKVQGKVLYAVLLQFQLIRCKADSIACHLDYSLPSKPVTCRLVRICYSPPVVTSPNIMPLTIFLNQLRKLADCTITLLHALPYLFPLKHLVIQTETETLWDNPFRILT